MDRVWEFVGQVQPNVPGITCCSGCQLRLMISRSGWQAVVFNYSQHCKVGLIEFPECTSTAGCGYFKAHLLKYRDSCFKSRNRIYTLLRCFIAMFWYSIFNLRMNAICKIVLKVKFTARIMKY